MAIDNLLKLALSASVNAGQAIMDIYKSEDFEIQIKSDSSPLTKADLAAHNIIIEQLKESEIPILSEEDADIPFETRSKWKQFWLVDPLDGTKEFIKKNDEFTVNIALIEHGKPILGVVYLPVFKSVYFASKEIGSFFMKDIDTNNIEESISNADKLPKTLPSTYTVVGSRSHMNTLTQEYFSNLKKQYGEIKIISKGSSLKLCMVADGSAHEYPRFGPTMEWDTAAGHAIALFSNAKVTKSDKKTCLSYNKEDLLNPHFIVKRNFS
jgi:3'(2'), 5'-bisphosphate nucleotidase